MAGTTTYNRTSGTTVDALPAGMVRCGDGVVRFGRESGPVVPKWRYDLSERVPEPSKANRVASWLVWHFWETAGVVVPAGLAVAVTPWAWLVSSAVAAGWAVHAVRFARDQAQVRAEPVRSGSERDSGADATPEATLDGPAPDEPDAAPAPVPASAGSGVADPAAGGVA